MNIRNMILRLSLFLVAGLFVAGTAAFAGESCTDKKTASVECGGACTDGLKASADDAACSAKQTASIDAKVLKSIYLASNSGDFSKVSGCATTQAALKKLTSTGAFCSKTKANVQTALDNGDFSSVAACSATREKIHAALASFAVASQGVDVQCLDAIEQAASSGDFSKVASCDVSRATLKKVMAGTSKLDEKHRAWVANAAEKGDFSEVSACETTRSSIQAAVCEFKDKSLKTALNTVE
jgi:hypothetical protein